MAVAAGVRFYSFINKLGLGSFNLNTDSIKIYLSNTAPNVATNVDKADLPEIATGNGYVGPIAVNNTYAQAGGVGSLSADVSFTITASGGSIGPFRYIVMYDDNAAGDPLMMYWDYGASITLNDSATFQASFANPPGLVATLEAA